MSSSGMLVVSNRLPVILKEESPGRWTFRPGNGGLVTALTPVLRGRRGTWVGWPGSTGHDGDALWRALDQAGERMGLCLRPVALSEEEVAGFYRGFSNEVLWPLFHDLVSKCNFDDHYWREYAWVNQKVSRVVARCSRPGDFVWVHDYHFLLMAAELRRLGVANKLGFFLHIPFPSAENFRRLPWRDPILRGLLQFDLIGFQTRQDRENFLDCVRTLSSAWEILRSGSLRQIRARPRDEGRPARGPVRSVRVGSFPISVDFEGFASRAKTPEVRGLSDRLRTELGDRQILLGVDRLDYTKGLIPKLRAFHRALVRYPELRRKVTLVQHVVPSRESVFHYRDLRHEIERLVAAVNGQFGTPDWIPVRYFYQALGRDELLAFYRLADALLVTSVKDGMNLVAKEYCAANVDETGVLILSEFTGAAAELAEGAWLVNPYDVEGLARRIRDVVAMDAEERRRNMRKLRRRIRERDVFHWVDTFLQAGTGEDEADDAGLDEQEDYVAEASVAPPA